MAKKSATQQQSADLPELDFDLGQRQRIGLTFRLTMTAPLSHIMVGNKGGNRSLFNKLAIVDPEGRPSEIPILSAGSFRTLVLRQAGIGATCRDLGLVFDRNDPISQATHNLLFTGGFQDAGDSAECDMALYPKVERYFAPLAVVGGCKPAGVLGSSKTQFLHGQLDCGHVLPVCYEAIGLVPTRFFPEESALAWLEIERSQRHLDRLRSLDGRGDVLESGTPEQLATYREARDKHRALLAIALPRIRSQVKPYNTILGDYGFTRRDAAMLPAVADLLVAAPKVAGLLEGVAEEKPSKGKGTSLMIAETEVAAAGSQWIAEWRSTGVGLTETAIGFLAYAILKWGENPQLGGQAARGCGGFPKIEVWYSIDGKPQGEYLSLTGAVQQLSDRAQGDLAKYESYLAKYRQYLADCGMGIKAFLGSAQ